jgi:hypothetical protein
MNQSIVSSSMSQELHGLSVDEVITMAQTNDGLAELSVEELEKLRLESESDGGTFFCGLLIACVG